MRYMIFLVLFPYCISWGTVENDRNFNCVGDYYKLTCTWDTDECTFWELTYRNRHLNQSITCTETSIRTDRMLTCRENCMVAYRCTGPKHNQCVIDYNGEITGIRRDQEYEFDLIGCSCDNIENHTYTVYTNDTITKLSLLDVVELDNGTRSVDFRVKMKQTICEICNDIDNVIICHTNLTSEWNSVTQDEFYRRPCDQINCFQDLVINSSSLTPYTSYEMDLSCKIETSKYWSDTLHKSFKTLAEVPLRGPDINNGSFILYRCKNNKECLALYFKTLNSYQSQGPLIKYIITVKSTDQQQQVEHREFDIIYNKQYPGTLFLNMPIENDHSYQITVNPVNGQGPALQASTVVIPQRKEVMVEPTCVDYTINNTLGSYMLSYQTNSEFDDSSVVVTVTYFWCRGVLLGVNEVHCKGDFDWITSNSKSIVVTPNFTLNDEFGQIYFAVSLSVNGVNSGITWRRCLPSPVIVATVYDKVIIGGAIGGFLGVVVIIAICWVIKKQADKIRSYNPEIKLPEILDEKFLYTSYTNQALDDACSGTSGYESVQSSVSSSNPSPDMGEKIGTNIQIKESSVYSLQAKTKYDLSTDESLCTNSDKQIQRNEKHRTIDNNNENNTNFDKHVLEKHFIDEYNNQCDKDKMNNSDKRQDESYSINDDSYKKVTDINPNPDIYFFGKGSDVVRNVPIDTEIRDNEAFTLSDNTEMTSDTTTVSNEEIQAGYCKYNIHQIDSDSSYSDCDIQDSSDNIDYSNQY